MIFFLSKKTFDEFLRKKLYLDPVVFIEMEKVLDSICNRNSHAKYDEDLYKLSSSPVIYENTIEAKQIRNLLYNSKLRSTDENKYDAEIGFNCSTFSVIKTESEAIAFFKKKIVETSNTSDFFVMIKDFYYELYFMDNVRQSMNVFNFKCIDTKTEILTHLDGISEHFKICLSMHEKERLSEIMKYFKGESSVECSGENDRDLVRKHRTIKLINSLNLEEIEDESFEPHTKLNLSDMKERIHFSRGNVKIQNGKIIISHIGKHLYDPQSGFKHDYAKLPKEVRIPFKNS